VLCAAIGRISGGCRPISAKTSWRKQSATIASDVQCPYRASFFEEAGEQTIYGNSIHTGDGRNNAELHRTIYHGHSSLLHFRFHHEPEHAAGTTLAVGF
jgi:hypothetical protein